MASSASVCGRGWIYGRGDISIGEGTWISPGTVFFTHCDASINIGSQCDIGPSVEFVVGSHSIGTSSRRAADGIARSIAIGSGTWIGAKALILDGVTIGSGCVIAGGSVVSRDIEANCLAAGVPAVIKKRLTNS